MTFTVAIMQDMQGTFDFYLPTSDKKNIVWQCLEHRGITNLRVTEGLKILIINWYGLGFVFPTFNQNWLISKWNYQGAAFSKFKILRTFWVIVKVKWFVRLSYQWHFFFQKILRSYILYCLIFPKNYRVSDKFLTTKL